ncbi:MAG: ABC transporter substrate-binding protein [Alphaproteobacteria bacterium]|nr:ABC transporter substrate-binding protein [Alphaproteobacteria bacterium]
MISRSPAVLIASFALLLTATAAAADPQPLRYGQAFSAERSVFSLPIHIAQRHGQFEREGLAVRQVFIPGGADRMITALTDDTVELTHVATPFLIQRVLGGDDVVAIAAEFNDPIYSLVARPEIKSVADLKGKLVGMADEAGPIAMSMTALLARHGLAAGDIRVQTISGTPQRLACLTRGACEAVPLGQPQDVTAEREGYRILGTSREVTQAYLYTVTAARRSWAGAHKDIVVRYVRALAAAFGFIRDPANRRAVAATIVDDTGCTEADARATLALYLEPERHVLPQHGEIDPEAMRRSIALMRDAGQLKGPLPPADRFIDLQYLRAAGIE